MNIRASSYFLMVILAIALVTIVQSARSPSFAIKLVPIIVAGVILPLAALELAREMLRKPEKEEEQTIEVSIFPRRFVVILAWIGGFFLSIYLLGFLLAIPLFMFTNVKAHGKGWLVATCLAGLMAIAMYAIFEVGLQVVLYRGLLLQ